MRIRIPQSLAVEHDELKHALLAGAREPGAVGEAMRRLAALLDAHFRKEESFALPPLGLLARLARGEVHAGMAQVLPHSDWVRNNLDQLVEEHRAIAAAAGDVVQAARAAGRVDYVEFAEKLVNHARVEEEVIYPAAVLVGEYLRLATEKRREVEL